MTQPQPDRYVDTSCRQCHSVFGPRSLLWIQGPRDSELAAFVQKLVPPKTQVPTVKRQIHA